MDKSKIKRLVCNRNYVTTRSGSVFSKGEPVEKNHRDFKYLLANSNVSDKVEDNPIFLAEMEEEVPKEVSKPVAKKTRRRQSKVVNDDGNSDSDK